MQKVASALLTVFVGLGTACGGAVEAKAPPPTALAAPPTAASAVDFEAARHQGSLEGSTTTRRPEASANERGLSPSVHAAPQRRAYALVVGIERYRDAPPPTGARADAEAFAEMLRTTFGVPEANMRIALDERATKSDIENHLAWLKANVGQGGRVFFYYSGHGAPDPTRGTPFLVPHDGDPRTLERTALALDDIIRTLTATRAREVLAFVDSCFSGSGGRSLLPPGARPLVRVKDTTPSKDASFAMLAASGENEISGYDASGKRGLFTKYLVEALGTGAADNDGDGQVSLEELSAYVKPRVSREAKRESREQNPTLRVSPALGSPGGVIVGWGFTGKR